MSRKNLSRTVIEGGRDHRNRWDRRQSHGDERASTRAWLDKVAADGDLADELVVPPRPRVLKSFRDKLGPARRWLAAQVGRPWDKVYSELRAKFDARTVAGAHVVDDHMLGWVDRGDRAQAWRHDRDFVVDAHGILRASPFRGTSRRTLYPQVLAFARGRHAARTRLGWWWFRVLAGDACSGPRATAPPELLARWREPGIRFVPDRAMTSDEVGRLARYPPEIQRRIVVRAP